jgi:hypothetical protein
LGCNFLFKRTALIFELRILYPGEERKNDSAVEETRKVGIGRDNAMGGQ